MGKEGFFITLEGGEGSGKTTVLGRVAAYLQNRSMPYRITREPGGIEIAEKFALLFWILPILQWMHVQRHCCTLHQEANISLK